MQIKKSLKSLLLPSVTRSELNFPIIPLSPSASAPPLLLRHLHSPPNYCYVRYILAARLCITRESTDF